MNKYGQLTPYASWTEETGTDGTQFNTVLEDCITYTVKQGDSNWQIAIDNYGYGEAWALIAAATFKGYERDFNVRGKDVKNNVIQPGDILYIPQIYKYNLTISIVKPGQDIWSIASENFGYGEVYTQYLEWNNWWANTYYTAFYKSADSYKMQNVDQSSLEAGAPLLFSNTSYFDLRIGDEKDWNALAARVYSNSNLGYLLKNCNEDNNRQFEKNRWVIIPMKNRSLFYEYLQEEEQGYKSPIGSDKYKDSGFKGNGYVETDRSKISTAPNWGVGVSKDINGTEMQKLLNANNIYTRTQLNDRYSKFNRFGYLDPYNSLTNTREYLFFTKPDLHIFENRAETVLNPELSRYSFFRDALERYPYVLYGLQQRVSTTWDIPFIPLLSNTVASSLDFPDASSEEEETMTNIYGTKLSYRGSSYKSDEQHGFSLEFVDTKFLEVYMFFKVFDEYEKLKKMGKVSPTDVNYIYRKILYDQIAIYKFIVDEDGETLLYWGKAYGVYPLSVPRGAISDLSDNSRLKFTIDFKCQFVEDMDPQILSDFNMLVINKYNGLTEMPLFDKSRSIADGEWAKIPYVAVKNSSESPGLKGMKKKYMLKWRK